MIFITIKNNNICAAIFEQAASGCFFAADLKFFAGCGLKRFGKV
jgi:hypothetical protein